MLALALKSGFTSYIIFPVMLLTTFEPCMSVVNLFISSQSIWKTSLPLLIIIGEVRLVEPNREPWPIMSQAPN